MEDGSVPSGGAGQAVKTPAVTLFLCCYTLWAGGQEKIPLLISDHHADHAVWFARQSKGTDLSLLLLDAHSDTAVNEERQDLRGKLDLHQFSAAEPGMGNHNWIHPLVRDQPPAGTTAAAPAGSLRAFRWIYAIDSLHNRSKIQGFLNTAALWKIDADYLSLRELRAAAAGTDTFPANNTVLCVSIDLDFFYQENYSPVDIPFVFTALLNYTRAYGGKTLWAAALSYPWQPDHRYAMNALEESLTWFEAQDCFAPPDNTLFSAARYDTSAKAASFRAEGQEPPSLYSRQDDVPERIHQLLERLNPSP